MDSPGWIILALGLTQYNLGAVVLTLKANGPEDELVKVKYSVLALRKLPKKRKPLVKLKL